MIGWRGDFTPVLEEFGQRPSGQVSGGSAGAWSPSAFGKQPVANGRAPEIPPLQWRDRAGFAPPSPGRSASTRKERPEGVTLRCFRQGQGDGQMGLRAGTGLVAGLGNAVNGGAVGQPALILVGVSVRADRHVRKRIFGVEFLARRARHDTLAERTDVCSS